MQQVCCCNIKNGQISWFLCSPLWAVGLWTGSQKIENSHHRHVCFLKTHNFSRICRLREVWHQKQETHKQLRLSVFTFTDMDWRYSAMTQQFFFVWYANSSFLTPPLPQRTPPSTKNNPFLSLHSLKRPPPTQNQAQDHGRCLWNVLPDTLRAPQPTDSYKRGLKTFLVCQILFTFILNCLLVFISFFKL